MAHPDSEGASEKPRSPLHILIVEDHPDGRESLRILLELHGHRVEAAPDGAEGLRMALESKPRVALIDINMPWLNGYEVAQRLREALGNSITLVACTANGQPEDVERAIAAGFDHFALKPVDMDQLLDWLKSNVK